MELGGVGIEHRRPVLLEHLAPEDLREEVGGILQSYPKSSLLKEQERF